MASCATTKRLLTTIPSPTVTHDTQCASKRGRENLATCTACKWLASKPRSGSWFFGLKFEGDILQAQDSPEAKRNKHNKQTCRGT